VATGARWRRDGRGRATIAAIEGAGADHVLTPDDVIEGAACQGPVLVYDDDHYYMGSVLAEVLRGRGLEVTLVTPAAEVAAWTEMTLELERIHRRLDELGVALVTHYRLAAIAPGETTLRHVHTERTRAVAAASVVLATARLPEDGLYRALAAEPEALDRAGIKSLARIGDCNAPGAIVHAVYDGHRWAQALDGDAPAVRRERPVVARAGAAGVAA
jgi:dimethylamine/trimethylamine dehydrogenase